MPLPESDADKLLTNPFTIGLAGTVVALKGAPGKTWAERRINAGVEVRRCIIATVK